MTFNKRSLLAHILQLARSIQQKMADFNYRTNFTTVPCTFTIPTKPITLEQQKMYMKNEFL